MMIGNRLLTFMLLLSLFCCSSAIRGQSRLDGRNVSEETRKGHRRAAHWGAAVKDVSVPPGVVERSHGSNNVEKGQAKKTRVDTTSEDDTFKDTREIVYNVDELAPKKAKGKKGQKGDDSLITAESDCDDPDDPRCAECDDSDDPKCQESAPTTATPEVLEQLDQEASVGDSAVGNSETSSNSSPGTLFPENYGRQFGIGSGSATGARNQSFSNVPPSPSTMQRSLTPFRLSFALTGSLYDADLDDGDYVELSDSTELYLTQYFVSYFFEEPTEFHEVQVTVQKTTDPLMVRFYVSAFFVIPGNVPTMGNLFDRMHGAFSGEGAHKYIAILNEMGLGNPFRNTRSVALINETPVSTSETGSEEDDESSFTSDTPKFLSVVISASVLLCVIVGLVWACRRSRKTDEEHIHQMYLEDIEQQDVSVLKKQAFSTKSLATDANTLGYLQTIRNRYRDDGGSKTDHDEISVDVDDGAGDEDDQTEATDNRQSLAEMREAMQALDSFASPTLEKSERSYPAPPSDGNASDEEVELADDVPQSTEKKIEYVEYLDLQSSFEEEDLRT